MTLSIAVNEMRHSAEWHSACAVMLSVIYAECRYAECRYAECRCAN
jgi:hypothetical protein